MRYFYFEKLVSLVHYTVDVMLSLLLTPHTASRVNQTIDAE